MAKANAKFMAPLTPSAELAAVVGSAALPAPKLLKKCGNTLKRTACRMLKTNA